MQRSVRRSKANLRRDMLAAGMLVMWTLTYASNMQDREQAIAHRKEWERRVRRVYPHYVGIAVMEQQSRGAWHWHIAVRDWFDVNVMRRLWQETIGEQARVHVGFRPDGSGNAYTKIAAYMSKYMGKSVESGEAEKHRYHVSGEIGRPERERHSLSLEHPGNYEQQLAIETAKRLLGDSFRAWFCPMSDSQKFGYAAFETAQQQPKGGEETWSG